MASFGLEQTEPDFATYHHVALTEDGGGTWQYLQDPCRQTLVERLAAAGDHLWLVCGGEPATAMEGKEVYRSDDGGKHWRLMAAVIFGGVPNVGVIPASGHVDDLVAASGTRAYLGLNRFTQIQTSDGGRTWRPSLPATEGGGPINFVDPTHGWAIGDRILYRTTDGLHWQRLGGGTP